MRILIATDAWRPQINGVVHSLERMAAAAHELGADCEFLTPQGFRTLPMPTYPDVRLAIANPREIARRIDKIGPDHVHIATEGPIGLATRFHCRRSGRIFTTSYQRAFQNMSAPAFRSRKASPTIFCAGSMRPPPRSWRRRQQYATN